MSEFTEFTITSYFTTAVEPTVTAIRIASAFPGRHDDLLYQLGEDLASLGVGLPLLTLYRAPLGMS